MHWRQRLEDVHPRLVGAVLARTVERSYSADMVLCREGDAPDGMYLLEQGRVLVQSLTIDGAAVGLSVVDEGDVVGEQALLAQTARSATVTAVRPTIVRLLRPTQFRELRAERPEIDQFLVQVLDARLREMSRRLAEAVHSSAEERVCRRVLALGSAFDGTIRLSQASLASLAGTTRPTVNRVLQDLVRDETVRLRRARIEVVNPEALAARIPAL
ncbi:Crp/Fnr family transcriptional regulator [Acidimicrobiales bacterium]|jgi:CRP/FNR family transcriptional regulator, cyclic AMP receptor protein|nr:Crp/Fnr family transcriptional regulator [Acidimicrobiales bacterium]MDG1086791.1 Crp/Fnr family transcriptional regulator [Acidimicrobiales bacterium]HAY68616.1 Crp/Fnr family transcriptional regulator [Acidimicrobiaceae bacterium]